MERISIEDKRELSKQVHDNAVKHGWWESKPSPQHFLCLVVCELAEAVEAARINKRANVERFEYLMKYQEVDKAAADGIDLYTRIFDDCIKDSIEDELADAYIRLLDLGGSLDMDWDDSYELTSYVSARQTFTESIHSIMGCATLTWYMSPQKVICKTAFEIEILAANMGIDLKKHIEMKMRYNINREYKHGKAF